MKNFLSKKKSRLAVVEEPFLISGEGRSGTTIMQLILNSHPDVTCGPEFHFRSPQNLGPAVLEQLALVSTHHGDFKQAKKFTEDKLSLQFIQRMRRFGVSEIDLQNYINTFMNTNSSNIKSFADRAALMKTIVSDVSEREGTSVFGFKIMRDHFLLRDYRLAYPGCKFVHITRDGRDVAASQIVDHSKWGYSDIRAAATSWAKSARYALKREGDDRFLSVKYEDLVLDTVPTLQRICRFLDLDYSSSMLEHERHNETWFANAGNHASLHGVKAPVNNRSIGRFKSDLSVVEIEIFEQMASNELSAFGYL